jgi:hypothetical protein
MQASTLHYTGDSNHTIARVGPCVFTLTLINQLKYGLRVFTVPEGYSTALLKVAYVALPCILITPYHI